MVLWPLIAALVAPVAEPDCTLQVSGQVVDATTGEGVERVTLTLTGGGTKRKGQTSEGGAFAWSNVCPGTYTLAASRPDYQPGQRRVTAKRGTPAVSVGLEPRAVDRLDDVVVVAPAPSQANVAHSSTLDEEALDAVRGQGLADALASIAGVTVLRSPGGGMGKPIIRGHVGRRNLILYDRVRHESQKWGIDHAPEIDPFGADSITVIKGAGAVRYGPDAIGGVVLIDPPVLPTTPGVSGEVHLIGASNGLRGTAATRVQGAHHRLPGFAWRAEANISRGAGLTTPEYPLDNTGSLVWNVGATVGYQRPGFSLTATVRHGFMKLGLFSGLRNETPDEFEQSLGLDRPVGADLFRQDYAIERAYQRTTHDLAMVRGRISLQDAGELVISYAYQDNRRDEFDVVRSNITGPQLEFLLQTHTAEIAFEQTPIPLGPRAILEGTVGGLYSFQRNEYDGSDPSFIADYTQHSGGVFAIERIVWPRVELEAGARYDGVDRLSVLDDRSYLPFRAQDRLPSDCQETEEGGRCRTPFHTGSGSLGALWRPVEKAPDFTITTDVSTASRFPATDEQFIKGSAPAFPVFSNGNGRLGVERTFGGALGIGFANPWVRAEAAAYGSYIDDYIYFRAFPQSSDPSSPSFSECAPLSCGVQGAFPLFEPTPTDSIFYGGEVAGNIRPPKWPVSFDIQASWVRALQAETQEPLVFIPPDRYRLGITYHWPDLGRSERGFIAVGGVFVDRQRRFDEEADFAPPPDAYGLLEASAGIEVPLRSHRFKFALSGRNLTNSRYRDYTSLLRYFANEPGWDLTLRITFEFDAARPTGPRRPRS